MFLEIGVGLTEMLAAKETAVSRKGGGVGSTQNQVPFLINAFGMCLRIRSPQQEHHILKEKKR